MLERASNGSVGTVSPLLLPEMREAGAFGKARRKNNKSSLLHSTISFPFVKTKKTQPSLKTTSSHTAPVTELSLPERIEEVLLPSAVRVPGFVGLVNPAEGDDGDNGKKKKSATKTKKPENGNDDGGKKSAKKRRKLEEEKKRVLAGSTPARCIAWNRYGTLLAGERGGKKLGFWK